MAAKKEAEESLVIQEIKASTAASVNEELSRIDESMLDILNYVVEKHKKFESQFDVLRQVAGDVYEVDAKKAVILSAEYPKLASWNLTEYIIANTRCEKIEESWEKWLSQRTPWAEQEMNKNKEHKTQATIKSKVSVMYSEEYSKWQDHLLRARADKEIMKQRIAIIHDARASLQALSSLSMIWNTQGGATQFNMEIIDRAAQSGMAMQPGQTAGRGIQSQTPRPVEATQQPPPPPVESPKLQNVTLPVPPVAREEVLPPPPPPPPPGFGSAGIPPSAPPPPPSGLNPANPFSSLNVKEPSPFEAGGMSTGVPFPSERP